MKILRKHQIYKTLQNITYCDELKTYPNFIIPKNLNIEASIILEITKKFEYILNFKAGRTSEFLTSLAMFLNFKTLNIADIKI
jgi:hypothetical protein